MNFGVGAIIENFDGTFLLHLRDEKAPSMKNEWCLIGGTSEENETPTLTLKREILEETGLSITQLSFSSSFTKKDNQREILIFHGKVDTRKQSVVIGEGKEIRFFTKDSALELVKSIENPNQYLLAFKDFLNSKEQNIGE